MNNETTIKKDWKYYVDSRPLYLILGLALAGYAWETGTIQKITDKLWNKNKAT